MSSRVGSWRKKSLTCHPTTPERVVYMSPEQGRPPPQHASDSLTRACLPSDPQTLHVLPSAHPACQDSWRGHLLTDPSLRLRSTQDAPLVPPARQQGHSPALRVAGWLGPAALCDHPTSEGPSHIPRRRSRFRTPRAVSTEHRSLSHHCRIKESKSRNQQLPVL